MNGIGAFICNHNKADAIVKCVQAVKDQTCQGIDIFVVDNASTDDSIRRLKEKFGDGITILQNEKNLGGSGGFGRGIRTALDMGYEYFMLIDNDAFLDIRAAEHLHDYLEDHGDVGICGAKVLLLSRPDTIVDLGGMVDLERYQWSGICGGGQDFESNMIMECDYVASCSLMARTEAVRVFGGFPEENFIYWDDIEWCTECRKAGYKVVVNGYARAYHDIASGSNRTNMFFKYYWSRNRYRYFTKYLPEHLLEEFFQRVTTEFFMQNYGAMNKAMYGTAFTAWNALDDFMHGRGGMAGEGKIVPYVDGIDRLAAKAACSEKVLIYVPGHTTAEYGCLNRLLPYLADCREGIKVEVVRDLEGHDLSDHDMVLQVCDHVTRIRENILPVIYVDRWRNYILDEKDYQYYHRFDTALRNFQEMYRPLFWQRVEELKDRRPGK